MPTKHPYNAVGAFIFAGGFTIGMSKRFNILAHLEDGMFGVETFKLNFPKIPVYTEPKSWPTAAIRAANKVHVVYCNPPCAPWSMAGKNKPDQNEARKYTLRAFGLIEELDPDIWVWESVSQAYTKEEHRSMSDHLTGQALEAGYAATHFLHDVKFMGLPQARRRLMTVFHRVKIDWPKTNGRLVTVREALKGVKSDGVPALRPNEIEMLKHTPPGGHMRGVWEKLHPGTSVGRPSFLTQRVPLDKPSCTIVGNANKFHPTKNRHLSPAEMAVLCGYPPDYKWASGPSRKVQELAKTVTAPAGAYMAKVFAAALDRNEPVDDGEEWLVNYQTKSTRLDAEDRINEVKRLR